jgi:hypothetical protein
MASDLLDYERTELLATLRGLTDRGAILAATRPYTLTTVREVTRRLTKWTPPASASRADMAYALAASRRRTTIRSPQRARRRDTSPEACKAALTSEA